MSEQLLKEILSEVKNLNHRFGSMEEEQSKIVSKVESLESKVDGLEARIESEVIDKLRVLVDAHSLYLDYFASLRDSQARIEGNIDFLVRQSIDMNNHLREHDRELRLLRAERPAQ